MPFGLTSEWHIFYWQIIGLLLVQLGLKTVMLFLHGARRWRKGVEIVVQVMGILIITIMVQARSYFVPRTTSETMSLKDLATINTAINLGFKMVLAICVVKLLWDIWQLIVHSDAKDNGYAKRSSCV
jgi:heme/copper-type cytochrome/quinol oxidase subunit 4